MLSGFRGVTFGATLCGLITVSGAFCSPLHPLRDGRVSENTVCLIRKLLVLDPQQRLTAGEVLESLSVIIASWQVLPLLDLRALAARRRRH